MSVVRSASIVTVLNLKGGVGKTHSVWLLVSACQSAGRKVLLVDTDTQGNLTNSFIGEGSPVPGIEALFQPGSSGDIRSLARATSYDHIDLVPASALLAPLDLSDQVAWEKADLHRALVHAFKPVQADYDYIVIDCPPRLSLVSYAALCGSNGLIIPLEAADWGAQGIVQVTAAADYVRKRHNPQLQLLGYLVSRFKGARAFQRSYEQRLRLHFGEQAMDTTIPDLAMFERSVTERVPITLYAPRSRAAGIAHEFLAEVERRLGKGGRVGNPSSRSGVHGEVTATAA